MVIVTLKGYYRYKRFPFGITISTELFQAFMDQLLADLEGVISVQDDIFIGGKDKADHLRILRLVLCRLQDAGLAIQPSKVFLLKTEIVFLGHLINVQGIRPIDEKVDAIRQMPAPSNVTELRSFLGRQTLLPLHADHQPLERI